MRATGLVAVFVLALFSLGAGDQTVRDVRPAPTVGTSAIGGRVFTADATPAPVRRARVVVTSSNLEVTRSTLTGDDGAFLLIGLPAGRYTVSASKPGLLRMSFGATRPARPGTAVSVTAGQKLTDLAIPMTRGGVVTGLVTDPEGRPARGVPVRVHEARVIAGERVLRAVNITPGTAGEKTDDRGEFRLFGLPPGDYIVSATPDDEGGGETRAAGGGTVGYVPVYFPGTTIQADAQTVKITAGDETSGVNVRLLRVRTARVEGIVSAPASVRPQDVAVTLVPVSTASSAGSYLSAVTALRTLAVLTPDWKFAYAGVTPGRYALVARVVQQPATGQAPTRPSMVAIGGGQTRWWAASEVTIDGVDRSDLALTLQPPMTVSGRIQFQSAPGSTAPDFSRVRVSLSSVGRSDGMVAFGDSSVTPSAAGQFTLGGVVPGRYTVRASVSGQGNGDWTIRSSMVNGRDTLDFPIDISPEEHLSGVVVTLTDVSQRLSGMLQDAAGRPASAFTIVVFPADKELWAVTRRIRTARPGQDGRYTINDLPAGDYRVAAVFDLSPGETSDPSFLETLAGGSVLLTIRPGERKVQDFRIAR